MNRILITLALFLPLPLAAQIVGINGVPGQTITGLTANGSSASQIISGCGVQYVSGLTFTVGACRYSINNLIYNSVLTNKTLATADPTNPRIDLIGVDTTSSVFVTTGTPSANPQEPTITTPASQLALTFVLVPAASTTPGNITTSVIYHNGTGWVQTPHLNVNPLSTNNPYVGTYDIEFGYGGNAQSGTNSSNTSWIEFANPSSATVNLANYNNLIFYIRNKAAWPSTCAAQLQWYTAGGAPTSANVVFTNGSYGFDTTNTTSYQQISIPISAMGVTNANTTNQLAFGFPTHITCSFSGFYVAEISLQAGTTNPPPPTTLMNFKGTWNATASYNANDTVVLNGIGYVALVANTNVALTNTAAWAQLGGTGSGGVSLTTNGTSGAATLSGTTLNIPQYQGAITLTTIGSSGPATFSSNVLNIPNYAGGGDTITSPGSTLSVGGTATNTTLDLNLGQGNTWTAAQTFNLGLTIGSGHSLTNTGVADGCGTWATGVLGSTGVPCGSGSGTVTGSGTTGFIPQWTSSSALGNSLLDYGRTIANQFNFGASVNVSDASHPSTFTLAYNSGHAPSVGSAGNFVIAPDASGNLDVSEGGAALSRVCTAANGACPSGGSSYTNVVASSSADTTVAAINAKCTGGQTYVASIPLAIATGGTIGSGCNVVHWYGGVWTIASGQTVTFANEVGQVGEPSAFFTGSGTVALSAQQRAAPFEWFGAVGDGNITANTGTDNTAAIQACLTAKPFQCVGQYGLQYKITSALSITNSNVGMAGVGGRNSDVTIIFSNSATADVLDVTGTNLSAPVYGTVLNNILLGRSVVPTGSTTASLSLSFTSGLTGRDLDLEDSTYNLHLHGVASVGTGTLDNIVSGHGYYFTGYSGQTVIGAFADSVDGTAFKSTALNNFYDVTKNLSGITSTCLLVKGTLISDFYADRTQCDETTHGIVVTLTSTGSYYRATNIHITNSRIDGAYGDCVEVNNVPSMNIGTVGLTGDNWCDTQSGSYGIEISGSFGVVLSGWQVVPNGGMTVAGVYGLNSSSITLLGSMVNIVGSSPGSAVLLNTVADSIVNANQLETNTTSLPVIKLVSTTTSSITSNNLFAISGATGISADSGSTNNSLESNSFDTTISTPIIDSGTGNVWAPIGTQSVSGCSLTSAVGTASTGSFHSGTSGTCTVTITPGGTASHGWRCAATDLTTPADTIPQTATSTTTCTISGTTVSADVITWNASPF